jgi:hypothetical protein
MVTEGSVGGGGVERRNVKSELGVSGREEREPTVFMRWSIHEVIHFFETVAHRFNSTRSSFTHTPLAVIIPPLPPGLGVIPGPFSFFLPPSFLGLAYLCISPWDRIGDG